MCHFCRDAHTFPVRKKKALQSFLTTSSISYQNFVLVKVWVVIQTGSFLQNLHFRNQISYKKTHTPKPKNQHTKEKKEYY